MSERVFLRGFGPASVDLLRAVWRQEDLGVAICIEGDGLVLRPRERVPPDVVPLLRCHKPDLRRLLSYDPPPAS